MKVLGDISNGTTKTITWASYGSWPDSWFFAYQLEDGTRTFSVGADIPLALQLFLEKIKPVVHLCSALRVQLGNNDSFIAWSGTSWACHGVPKALEAELSQMSWTHMRCATVTKGSLKSNLKQIAWHGDGSYFVESQEGYYWNFESSVARQAWSRLWVRKPTHSELSELVVSAPVSTFLPTLTQYSSLLWTRTPLLGRPLRSSRSSMMHGKRHSLCTSTKIPRTLQRHLTPHLKYKIHVYSLRSESQTAQSTFDGPSASEAGVLIPESLGNWSSRRDKR